MKNGDTGGAYFFALGGGDEIGKSMYVSVFPKENIIAIFDCGIEMLQKNGNADTIRLPDFSKIKELIAGNPEYRILVFLTHGHMDHIGAVAKLKKDFPQARIFATEPTAAITEVMGIDSINIRDSNELTPHFTEDELYECTNSIEIIRSSDWKDLVSGFRVRFEPAGHIRGASSVLLGTPYGILAYSGDINFRNTTTVRGASMKLEDKVRWLLIESTNGNDTNPDPEEVMKKLIVRTVEIARNGGNILIPAFAVGRCPDVGIRLGRELMKYGIQVWSGGLFRKVAEVCSSTRWESDIRYESSTVNRGRRSSYELTKENIYWVHRYNYSEIAMGKGKVVVIPHGMLEAGYSQDFCADWADNPNNAIFLVGYQAEGTCGRELGSHKESVTITSPMSGHTETVRIKAKVESYRISGHADGNQLASWVHQMGTHDGKSIDKLILVHGDKEGQEGLGARLIALPNRPKEILVGVNNQNIIL